MAEDNYGELEASSDMVGHRLVRAREAMGLSRADIAARTRIAERHLAAIEDGRFSDLASSTYAVGFSRAYARTVGLDEFQVAASVRSEMAGIADEPRHAGAAFEPGDPARVPASRTAWLAALGALLVAAVVFLVWRSYFVPSVSLPDLTSDTPPAAASAPAAAPVGAPPPAPVTGQVVFTAQADGVWVKFYDAAGKQLMQKQMALGETYAVPADAQAPMLWTARPDALAITVGGRPVPPLSTTQVTMKNVPVTAAALLARAAPAPVPSAAPAALAPVSPAPASAVPAAAPAETARPAAPALRRQPPSPRPQVQPSPAPVAAEPAAAAQPAAETSTVSN